MLNGRNIQTHCPSWKLDHKNHRSFQVGKVISPLAVKLTLPRKWRIHDVFHISLLEPYRAGEMQVILDPVKVLWEEDNIENSKEYNVDEIIGSTKKERQVLYLVKWLDYPNQRDWTNKLFDNFSEGGFKKLREFHRQNPEAPRDYRLAKE